MRLVSVGLKQDAEMIGATFKYRPTCAVGGDFLRDMEIMTKFLHQSKRSRQRQPTLEWMYTEPLARIKAEWVKSRGLCKGMTDACDATGRSGSMSERRSPWISA